MKKYMNENKEDIIAITTVFFRDILSIY
ncbi:MAG: hypothetical protein C5S41_01675 [Candidatus Methanomarinus sp.]|nr:MAG: hypothetical protein C5S41_01675 [ANME-2 cluster archaeon]